MKKKQIVIAIQAVLFSFTLGSTVFAEGPPPSGANKGPTGGQPPMNGGPMEGQPPMDDKPIDGPMPTEPDGGIGDGGQPIINTHPCEPFPYCAEDGPHGLGGPIDGQPPMDGEPMDDKPPMDGEPMGDKPPMDGEPMGDKPPMDGEPMGDKPPMDGKPMGDKPPMDGEPMGDKPPMDGEPMGDKPPMDGEPMDDKPPMDGNKPIHKPTKLEEMGIKPGEIEHFENLKPEELQVFGADDMKNVPNQAFQKMGRDHFKDMPRDAMEGMTPEQFREVPPDAMSGLEADNMGGLSPEVIGEFEPEHIGKIDKEQFKKMPEQDRFRIIVNFDPNKVNPEDIRGLLEGVEGVEINEQGEFKAAPGKKLAFPHKQRPKDKSPRMKIPELPDFAKGFGLGGQVAAGKDVLTGLDQGLAQVGFSEFTFEQRDDGVLNVKGSGLKLGFTPDTDEMVQADPDAPIGLSEDERGRYVVTTPDRQKFPMNPAPHDPDGLLEAIGEQGSCEIGELGATRIDIGNDKFSTVFNPFVEERGPMEKKHGRPLHNGLNMFGNVGVMLYPDGSAQELLPTMHEPNIFQTVAENFPGVEKVTPNVMDGRIKVVFQGLKLILVPGFNIIPPPEPKEGIEPNITLNEQSGWLEFEDELGNVQTMSYMVDEE